MSAIAHPPLPPLHSVLLRLEHAGIPHALGGSGLLAALGLVDRVNDWDVTADADPEDLARACEGLTFTLHGNDGLHADHKLALPEQRTELIARFAFFVPAPEGRGIVRIPTVVTDRWREVPIGSPSGWAVAYALMGEFERSPRRAERAELLFEWISRHGADVQGLEALAREPLPDGIRARLVAATRNAEDAR